MKTLGGGSNGEKRRQEHFKNVIFCLLGTLIIALGVNCFVIPGNLGEGGAIGLSLILNYTCRYFTGAKFIYY